MEKIFTVAIPDDLSPATGELTAAPPEAHPEAPAAAPSSDPPAVSDFPAIPGRPAPPAVPDFDAEIMKLLAPRKKIPKSWFFLAGGLFLAAVATVVIVIITSGKDDETATIYREYTVMRGDITVGNSESSSISLDRETVTFPVSASVEEVYVKTGSSVKEGDPLVRFNLDDIEAGRESYELQLKTASLELEQAKLEQQTQLLNAQHTYDTSILNGALAEDQKDLSVQKLVNSVSSAAHKVESAEDALDNYLDQYDSYDGDTDNLEEAKTSLELAESTYNAYQAQLSALRSAAEIQSDLTAAQATVTRIEAIDVPLRTPEDEDTLTQAKADVTAYTAELSKRNETASLAAVYQSSYNSIKETCSQLESEYKENYGSYSSKSDIEDKITSAYETLENARASYQEALLTQQSSALSDDQKLESSEQQSSTAATKLKLASLELEQAIAKKQEAYNEMLAEIEEIKESLSDDGIIYSPCTGMIASINVTDGDSFTVYYDENTGMTMSQTILTLTDISNVYVPITISEEDILNVSIGQEASVTMTAFEGRTFEAEVDTIVVESSRSGAATVSYTVNVRFSDENELSMFEGMSAEITLIQKQVTNVLTVSTNAITYQNGVSTVRLRSEGAEPVTTEVVTGFSDGQYVEIVSGLSAGDVVLAQSGVGR